MPRAARYRLERAGRRPVGGREPAHRLSRAQDGLETAEISALAGSSDPRTRGHTVHEHLDRTGLIHRGGRVYDPTLGRFLSPVSSDNQDKKTRQSRNVVRPPQPLHHVLRHPGRARHAVHRPARPALGRLGRAYKASKSSGHLSLPGTSPTASCPWGRRGAPTALGHVCSKLNHPGTNTIVVGQCLRPLNREASNPRISNLPRSFRCLRGGASRAFREPQRRGNRAGNRHPSP